MHTALAATLGLALCASAASAQNCVDQFYFPTSGNGLEVTSGQSVQQTFIVAITGQLEFVELYELRHHRGISIFDLRFDLVPLLPNGAPTANPVASVLIPPSALSSTPSSYSVDLRSQHVRVVAGEAYAIHLESSSPSNGATYAWGGDAPGGYVNGDTWIGITVGPLLYDMGFATRIEKTPGLLLDLSQPDGSRTLRISQSGGVPGDFFILALTFDPGNAAPNTGRGPWAGLFIPTSELIGELEVGFPFVGQFDSQGNANASFFAPTVPAFVIGRTLWGVSRDFDPLLIRFRADSPVESVRMR